MTRSSKQLRHGRAPTSRASSPRHRSCCRTPDRWLPGRSSGVTLRPIAYRPALGFRAGVASTCPRCGQRSFRRDRGSVLVTRCVPRKRTTSKDRPTAFLPTPAAPWASPAPRATYLESAIFPAGRSSNDRAAEPAEGEPPRSRLQQPGAALPDALLGVGSLADQLRRFLIAPRNSPRLWRYNDPIMMLAVGMSGKTSKHGPPSGVMDLGLPRYADLVSAPLRPYEGLSNLS